MSNVLVVGAGIFGSVITRALRAAGHQVTVFDSGESWAASKASGCVLAPSWAGSMHAFEIEKSAKVLNSLFTVHPVQFRTHLGASFKANRIDLNDILVEPGVTERVVGVSDGRVATDTGKVFQGTVVVAAGIHSDKLVAGVPPLRALWGASVRFRGQVAEPRLYVYAPYRQAVAFNLDKKNVWMGDGTALVTKTWERESGTRTADTVERGRKLFHLTDPKPQLTIGARPYVEGHKAGYFAQHGKRLFVSTGGAKNGTLLAGYHAQLLLEMLK